MFFSSRTTYYDNGKKKYQSWPKGRCIPSNSFLLLHQSIVWYKNGQMKSKVLYDPREPETNKQICWYSNGQKKSEGRHYLVEHRWASGSAKGGKWSYWGSDGNKTIKFEH